MSNAGDVVTNLDSSGPGSLSAVIAGASAGDTVTFASGLSGTITLSSPIEISSSLSIAGPGATVITVSGGGTSSLFEDFLASGTSLSISGLTLADASSGKINGAIDLSSGSLQLSDDVFVDNVGSSVTGGRGDISISDTAFEDNVGLGHQSGAINADGPLSISTSTFDRNSGRFGGAVQVQNSASISRSTFVNNQGGSAGAVSVANDDPAGPVSISKSTFANNTGSVGGALALLDNSPSASQLVVADDTFVGNDGGQGGALYLEAQNAQQSVEVVNSTMTGNQAGTTTSPGQGGAIATVSDAGGLPNPGPLDLDSDTIDGNTLGAAGGSGSGLWVQNWDAAIAGTIVANNTGAANCDLTGSTVSVTNSLEGPSNATSCGFDLTSADPQLGPLSENGGPTESQAPAEDSPAVGAIPNADCPMTDGGMDQRGQPRPAIPNGPCDVGAYQTQTTTTSTTVSCQTSIVTGSPNACDAAVTATDQLTPTGSISYQAYTDAACSAPTGSPQQQNLGAGGEAPPFSVARMSPGQYYVQAVYQPAPPDPSGFAFQGSQSTCVGFNILRPGPIVELQVDDASSQTPWTGNETSGAQAQAHVSLENATDPAPTGTVTDTLYPANCSAAPLMAPETVSITETGEVPDSSPTPPLAPGSYNYVASYSGDSNYAPATSDCEPFTVGGTAGPPAVTKVSPSHGSASGGKAIDITGTGFLLGATVVIGQGHGPIDAAIPATNVKVMSSTQITATTGPEPSMLRGTFNLYVTDAGGTSPKSRSDRFTYTAPVSTQH